MGDAVEFVLQNFTEMNKLWVRMKHQGPVRERAKREKERKELRDLIGKNLVILSSMEEIDEKMYGEIVLPRVLEQVVNCKDELAQNYLMDCVIQVFPDEFHIRNLETFLESCGRLCPGANVSAILCGLIRRLSYFVDNSPESASLFEEVGAFKTLLDPIGRISSALDPPSVASIYSAVLDFAVGQKNETLDRVDVVLANCAKALGNTGSLNSATSRTLKGILTKPLDTYSIIELLDLGSYPDVMRLLDHTMQKQVAVDIVEKILKKGTVISEVEKVESLFDFISMLLEDESGSQDEDEDDIEEEQNLIARLVHQMKAPEDDVETSFKILQLAKERFAQGGPLKLKHTLPTVVFDVLQLIKRCQDKEKNIEMLQYLNTMIDLIAEVPQPEKAFKLYLQCTLVADSKALEDNAYDFMTAAFDIYENSIPDTKAQMEALAMLIGTLSECENFGEDNWDTLITTATKWSVKLLKKRDQCKSVYSCSHLFWKKNADGSMKDPTSEKLLVCLKRSLTIAKQAQGIAKSSRGDVGPVELFIAILNKYLYFFDQQKEEEVIKTEDVQNLLDLVSNETSGLTTSEDKGHANTVKFYHNTLRHIMHLKEKSPEKYAGLSLGN